MSFLLEGPPVRRHVSGREGSLYDHRTQWVSGAEAKEEQLRAEERPRFVWLEMPRKRWRFPFWLSSDTIQKGYPGKRTPKWM